MHAAKRENKIRGRGSVGKRIVHGLLERGGEVRATVVPTTEASELQPLVREHVAKGSIVNTDAHASYAGLQDNYIHAVIDHAISYVAGNVHTNGIENFWALFKRMLKGTYVSIAPFHLQRYVDEETFRFNSRKGEDADRFSRVMKTTIGRRVTYRQLCEIVGCGFMGLQ